MRNFLTFVAVALVTALTVALVAPPFIDWSARRDMVANAIAARIGAPVSIGGPITLRLLPTPYLQAADVAIGPPGAPWLKGPAMRFEFAFASLLAGKVRLDDVIFDRPQIRLGPTLRPPREGRLEFGHIRAVHADIRIEREGAAPIALADVSFDGAARSPRGPWRGGGDFTLGPGRASYEIAADAFDGALLPLKADLTAGATRIEFDGRLLLDETPSLAGTATMSGEAEAADIGRLPWRIAGEIAGQGDAASMANAEIGSAATLARWKRRGRCGSISPARPSTPISRRKPSTSTRCFAATRRPRRPRRAPPSPSRRWRARPCVATPR